MNSSGGKRIRKAAQMAGILFFAAVMFMPFSAAAAQRDTGASLDFLRQTAKDADDLLAVAYLGFGTDFASYMAGSDTYGRYLKEYPFLADIPRERWLNAGGYELYALVPADSSYTVSVCSYTVDETNDYHKIEVEDLLPPPCCYVSLGLVDNKHFETYKKEREAYEDIIPFEGLSSGERQIAYSISSLMYHLINIDSTVDDKNPMAMETIHYEHANVMMDEVELYFHPDLQRRFVKLLVDSLNSMRWRYLQSVNVTLITHSPFVLSDIPMTNVLCLTREGVSPFYDRTFAANIHDLFNNTFVLPDTIEKKKKTKIKELVDFYYQKKKELDLAERDDSSEVSWPSRSEAEYFKYLINIVGDEYLQSELEDMWKELLDNYREIES